MKTTTAMIPHDLNILFGFDSEICKNVAHLTLKPKLASER